MDDVKYAELLSIMYTLEDVDDFMDTEDKLNNMLDGLREEIDEAV